MKYKLRNIYPTEPSIALQSILSDRGVTDIKSFIKPSKECELNPYNLDNIEIAADLLLNHLRKNSSICFIVDADCDGFTSSSILWLYIKNLFPDADLHFTVHEHKQHGLDDKIDWLIEDEQFDLILIPDAGSYDLNCHKQLKEIGTDILVLDHHEPPVDKDGKIILPNSDYAVVVNNQLSKNYANKTLCGAGIVYKFCEILDNKLGIKQAHNYIDLVALGEIADVMDRKNTETNYLMMEGLKNIKNRGFQALLEAQSFSLKEKAIFPYPNLTPIDIAFYIAPLINAITRVGSISDKEALFYCFIEPDRPLQSTKRGAKPGDIELAAVQAARVGANAKSKQNRIKEKAIDLIDFKIQKNQLNDNNIIIVELDSDDDIPQEMTGLIAMAIVSKYHKPVMIGRRNTKDEIQGSIRSDGNFSGLPSFKKFLEDSNLIIYAMGHDNACGFGVAAKQIDNLLQYSNQQLNAKDFENCYTVDYILDGSKDNTELIAALAQHPEYFGNHIDEIKLVIKNISLANIMVMGTNKDSMKISYNGIDYVHFKDLDFVEEVFANRAKTLTVYGRANLNTFAGRTSIQCFIDDYCFENDTSKYDF